MREKQEAERRREFYWRSDRSQTERQDAVLEEGMKGWLAEHLEATKGQEYGRSTPARGSSGTACASTS